MSSVLKTYLALLAEKQLLSTKPGKKTLGESILVLLEAKIDQYIEKNREDPKLSAFLNAAKEIRMQPKYLDWAIRAYKNPNRPRYDDAFLASNFNNYLEKFDNLLRKNQIPIESRDINSFKDFFELKDEVDRRHQTYALNKRVKEKQAAAENTKRVVYEDETYLVIEPQSTEASCKYGAHSKWCISATVGQNHFEEYSSKGVRFLFIINKKTNDKDAISFAGDVNTIEIFDAQDGAQRESYISQKYPVPVLKALNDYLDPVIGISPFQTFDDVEMYKNPMKILEMEDPTDILSVNRDVLLVLFRRLLSVEVPNRVYADIRRNLIKSGIEPRIRDMKATDRGASKLLEIVLMDPNQAYFDMNWQNIKKLFFHVLYEDMLVNDLDRGPSLQVPVVLAYFPEFANTLLSATNWEQLVQKFSANSYDESEALKIRSTVSEMYKAIQNYVKSPELRALMWNFSSVQFSNKPDQLAEFASLFDQIVKASNFLNVHSYGDMVRYCEELVSMLKGEKR